MTPTEPTNPAFASADEQTMFDWVWHEVAASETRPASGKLRQLVLFVGTLALFVWAADGWADPFSLAVLVGAVLFHELGHYLGMRAFGYRDVKMFFIPFIGAAVSGKKHAAPVWQRGIVSLLGPLPGILLGAVVYAFTRQPFYEGIGLAILIVIGLNVLNLIPVEPLDGGRLMTTVIFCRSPTAEAIFGVIAALAIGLVGWLGDIWLFIGIAAFVLLTTRARYTQASRAAELRREFPDLPAQLDALPPDDRLALFRSAVALLGGSNAAWPNPNMTATIVRVLHEGAVVRPPGLVASLTLLSAYGLGFVVTLGVATWWVLDRHVIQTQVWVDYERGQQLVRDADPIKRQEGFKLLTSVAETSRKLATGGVENGAERPVDSPKIPLPLD